jgi:hypothetical protein
VHGDHLFQTADPAMLSFVAHAHCYCDNSAHPGLLELGNDKTKCLL